LLVLGQLIKCAECGQERPILFTLLEVSVGGGKRVRTYYTECGHCNIVCPRCGGLAKNVSDTAHEVQAFCDACAIKGMNDAEA
jgi:hypothetical protein